MNEVPRYFFVHIMRTGGATFTRQIERNFAAGEVYPYPPRDADMVKANFDISYLLGLPPERAGGIRVYTGHFPYFVTKMTPWPNITTITILRDPVERTISLLRERQREAGSRVSLEACYDSPAVNECMLLNFQTKQFAMSGDDDVRCAFDPLELDEQRLEAAKANLAKVDVVGLHERYEEFMHDVMTRFHWERHPIPNWHVSERSEVPAALEERIRADNALDVAFYEYAVELCDERRAS